MTRPATFSLAISWLLAAGTGWSQNRGVYPLGMTATNSGLTPEPGFTYSNQLLFYARDKSKDNTGATLPVEGTNAVVMDMNSFIWVSRWTILGNARYSAVATLPFARNNLTTEIDGRLKAGGGFADSYYIPLILGWSWERVGIRAMYGFLAPTGRFSATANDNVGSGYWTHAISTGQTWRVTKSGRFAISAFELYEFHTTQIGTGTRPGQTFNLDYSAMLVVRESTNSRWELGLAGYEQRQTTATRGPQVTEEKSTDRYAVNALGAALSVTIPRQRLSFAFKAFKEFANRATFEGYSLQGLGTFHF